MKATKICLILLLATALVYVGYELGKYEARKQTGSKVLNDWFWEYESRPQVYKNGFIELPKAERDSLYQDALLKL
jgi:hypothetical protein